MKPRIISERKMRLRRRHKNKCYTCINNYREKKGAAAQSNTSQGQTEYRNTTTTSFLENNANAEQTVHAHPNKTEKTGWENRKPKKNIKEMYGKTGRETAIYVGGLPFSYVHVKEPLIRVHASIS